MDQELWKGKVEQAWSHTSMIIVATSIQDSLLMPAYACTMEKI